jgi:pimeloyl-ACP methyl ester carboxylesterase
MSDVGLVHGALHGAWCWERLAPVLAADPRTDRVIAVDLPGHGTNRHLKPTDEITLDDYVDHLVGLVEAEDLHDVVLVGHSLGGITITPASHRLEDRMRRLVGLTSIHPPAGRSVLEVMFEDPRPEMQSPVRVPDDFTTDFDAADAAWLADRLGPQPALPMTAPVEHATAPASVPVTYILCGRDEALIPAVQAEQAARLGAEVARLDAGHSPFVTHVDELATIILDRCEMRA